jgi:hypothetical protein
MVNERVMQNEELADAYDIQRYAVTFEGSMWYHKNTKWTGDRYVLVWFNTDFSKHDRERGLHGPDTQTEEERARPALTRPVCTPIDTDSEECVALRAELMEEIQKVDFLNKRQRKYSSKSAVMFFGECTRPYKPKARFPCRGNALYPKLHMLLNQYLEFIVKGPRTYSTILLAKNSQCDWHLDKQNVSSSVITGLGGYGGGLLLVNHKRPHALFECMQCHLKNACRRTCRVDGEHTAGDWLPEAWAYIKEHGVSSVQTRKAMKASANQNEQKPHRE